jgi:hypothetical protein
VGIVVREMVDHPRQAGMHVTTAEIFRADDFTGRGLDERWTAEKDRALVAHDDRLVAHRGDIGTAGRA